MPDEWEPSAVVPIFKEKEDAMSCRAYRGVKLLKHVMMIVEKVLEEIEAYGESGRDAIWFYARQRNDRWSVHFEVTRGVLRQEEVEYVLR